MRRVLSIQSHVVHGYVGNRSAVFPLQLLGFDVDVINSVQFSCHTGYPAICGQRLNCDDLRVLTQGLATNQVLDHEELLTGYIGDASFLREVVDLRKMLPPTCRHICDPVMGDNGTLYVPEELVGIYRVEVLPGVAVLTPNQFEAQLLAEMKIGSLAQAAEACDKLHRLGPPAVVLTTLETPDATNGGKDYAMMLSEVGRPKWLLRLPLIEGGPFTGTGDLAAAMILAWTTLRPHEAPASLEATGAVLQAVLRNTMARSTARTIGGKWVPPELRLLECKRAIEQPLITTRCELVEPLELRAVIFDMDGTLTLPGQIDFVAMRSRLGVLEGVDIVPYLRKRHAGHPEALAAALAIVVEEELKAFCPPRLQPGLKECIQRLLAAGIRLGIVTRNCGDCVNEFLRHAELPADTFSPVVTRDTDVPNKPDPAPVHLCCAAWGIDPAHVLVVGDSIDDMLSGRAAGSHTVAILESRPGLDSGGDETIGPEPAGNAALAASADFTVSSLDALRRFFL